MAIQQRKNNGQHRLRQNQVTCGIRMALIGRPLANISPLGIGFRPDLKVINQRHLLLTSHLAVSGPRPRTAVGSVHRRPPNEETKQP